MSEKKFSPAEVKAILQNQKRSRESVVVEMFNPVRQLVCENQKPVPTPASLQGVMKELGLDTTHLANLSSQNQEALWRGIMDYLSNK